jgi:hypothetical protein
MSEPVVITAITCGPQCADGTEEHQWDGPTVVIDHGGSVSCSKCGRLAIDVSLWMDDGLAYKPNRAKGVDTL